jgi:hypothetical protein
MDHAVGKLRDGAVKFLFGGDDPHEPCDVFGDHPRQMTNGRLLARFLSRYAWYHPPRRGNPTSTGEEQPEASLDRAWAYYEHYTLARIFAVSTDVNNAAGETTTGQRDIRHEFVRAPAGEADRPTVLYPLLRTPTQELGDWGFSVRLYFSTLRIIAAALFVAGLLNLPLSVYFYAGHYSSQPESKEQDIPWLIQTSALCTDHQYIAELDTKRNVCNFDDWLYPGLLSYGASLLILIQLVYCFFIWQRKAEVVFDEEIQTASDYSIKVTNVPPTATDPQEWKDYFDQFTDTPERDGVTFVSIAIDNAELLYKLVERRKLLRTLRRKFPKVDHCDADAIHRAKLDEPPPSWWSRWCCCGGSSSWDALAQLDDTIRTLLRRDYAAVAVFVIFESERAQRNALHCLSTGRLQLWNNHADLDRFRRGTLHVRERVTEESLWEDVIGTNPCDMIHGNREKEVEMHSIQLLRKDLSCEVGTTRTRLDRILRFHGRVLKVKEACEPNDVRWPELQVPTSTRTLQYVVSTLAMIAFVAWAGFFIHWLEGNRPGMVYTPLFITATNIVVPSICEVINAIESHSTEASRQASLYSKVALFRWFNSAIAITLVFSFTQTISIEGKYGQTLGEAAYSLICAELFSGPIYKMCDFYGFYRKHYLAPRAHDQEEMNACFVGTRCDLAERYTDATKVLCVALFFSSILPASLFLGAAAMAVQFAQAKFALLRMGATAIDVGSRLSRLSRNVFFSSSLVLHFVMCAYWWSGYPYDNVCQSTEDGTLQHCNQDFLRQAIFPPFPRYQTVESKWMTSSQETIVSLYAWTALVVVITSMIILLRLILIPFFDKLFESNYEPNGRDQGIRFSEVKMRQEVEAYIPHIKETGFSYPFLACDCSNIDADLLDWKNHKEHPETSVMDDIREILHGSEPKHTVLSPVQHWSYGTSSK